MHMVVKAAKVFHMMYNVDEHIMNIQDDEHS
jgi:hypothetical protein